MRMKGKMLLTTQALISGWMGIAIAQPAVTEASEAREKVIRRFEQEAPEIGGVFA